MKQILIYTIIILCSKVSFGQEWSAIYPKINQSVNESITLSWNKKTNSTQYQLKVYKHHKNTTPILDTLIEDNIFNLVALDNGTYYWDVFAFSNALKIDSLPSSQFQVFNPSEVNELLIWLKSDQGIVEGASNEVISWQDQSDSAYVVNQPNATQRPILLQNQINGFPAVDFDPSNDKFDLPIGLTNNNFIISVVYNTHQQTNSGIRVIDGANNWLMGPHSGTHRAFVGTFTNGKSVTPERFVIHSVRAISDTVENFVNASSFGKVLASYPPGDPLELGRGNGMNGSVAELVVIGGQTSDSTRALIDKYLMDKYAPPVNLGADRVICTFPDTIKTEVDYAINYTWSDGSTSDFLEITNSGTYYLTITDIFDRQSVDSIIVTQNLNNYQVNLIPDTILCIGDTIQLYGGSELYQYNWNDGSTLNYLSVTSTDNYSVTVTNCLNQVSIDTVYVDFTEPIFNLGIDTTFCFYDSLILKAANYRTPQYSYNWSNGKTVDSIVVKNAGSYQLEVTDSLGCSYYDTINISVDSTLFGIDLGEDTALCIGNEIGLLNFTSNTATYIWSNNEITPSIELTNGGKYAVTVNENGCSNSDSVLIQLKSAAPLVDFSVINNCLIDSIYFIDATVDTSGVSLNSWTWFIDQLDTSNSQNTNFKFDTSGIYNITLEVTNDSNCIGSITKAVSIDPMPISSFSVGSLCQSDTFSILNTSSISSGAITSYLWDFGVSSRQDDTSNVFSPNFSYPQFGKFPITLISTSNLNCSDTLVDTVNVNSSPISNFTYRGKYFGDTIRFTNLSSIAAGNIVSTNWSFGDGQTSTFYNPKYVYDTTGTYEVALTIVSDSNCISEYKDSVRISLRPPPEADFTTISPVYNQTLNQNIWFQWNYIDTINVEYHVQLSRDLSWINPKEEKTLLNSVSVDNLGQGKWFWRVIAELNNTPVDTTDTAYFNVLSPDSISNIVLWLNGDNGLTIQNSRVSIWEDQSKNSIILSQQDTSKQPRFIPNALNNYGVVYFDEIDDIFPTTIDLSGSEFSISAVYNWNEESNRGARLIDGTTNWLMGPHAGRHRAFAGLFSPGKTVVKDKYASQSVISLADTLYNFVNGIDYDSVNANYRPGIISLANQLNGSLAELLIVNGNVDKSLVGEIDNYLMDKYAPPLELGENKSVCNFPDSILIQNESYTNFLWSTGDTTSKLIFDSAGLYKVTVTDIFDRIYVDSLFIDSNTFDYNINLTFEDTTICSGDSLSIYAGNPSYNYQWSNGDTNNVTSFKQEGKYYVTVSNCFSNQSVDSFSISINNPQFDLGVDTIVCFNLPYTLEADSNFSNVNYLWSTGEVTNSIIANQDQIYSLTVTDQFSCDFTDSIQITIDSSLFTTTLGPDTTLCIGNSIGLYNVPNNQLTYVWSAGSNLPTQLISNAGEYRVSVTNGLCEIADTIQISVKGTAPIVDFVANQFCVRDSVRFSDLSQARANETIVAWNWDFGNGDTSIMQNPNYFYGVVDSFRTQLTVVTNTGCSDTSSKVIYVYPNPNSWFGIQKSCAKSNASFRDSTSIQSGFISTYRWNFGDTNSANNTSTQRNPIHSFDTLGQYLITLITESDRGCKDTIQRFQQVNATPNVDFSFTGHCLNDSTYFTNETVLAAGQISSHYWTFNTNLIKFQDNSNENPVIQLVDPGTIYVTLREITDQGCVSFHQDTFQMRENPVAGLLLEDYCEDVPFAIYDNSSSADSISKYTWVLEPNDTVFDKNPTFLRNTDGFYGLKQKVESEFGCLDSNVVTLKVNPKPTSRFNILNNGSGRPYKLRVSNTSIGANSYVWHFGNGDSSLAEVPTYTYNTVGNYNLSLVATSGIGCVDTSFRTLNVSSYLLDALLEDIFLTETFDGRLKVAARVVNSGNNTIETMQLTARLNNDFQFTEQTIKTLYKGERSAYEFSSTFLQGNEKKVDFVCVKIERLNGITLNDDNELCEKAFNNEVKFEVYPNPATDAITLRYVLPFGGQLKFEVFDQVGRRVVNQDMNISESGLYLGSQDISFLKSGLYTYRFIFNGADYVGHFIKN